MAVRNVIQIGHPALKAKNKKITSFSSVKTRKLLKDLRDTMYKTGLIGIAAPQIAQNYMVFVTHPRNTEVRKLPKTDKSRIYINPKISYYSKKMSLIYEACGSVSVIDGFLFGPVSRAEVVEITAYDEKGNKFSLKTDGILARVIQHEYDHLRGVEFIQKVDDYAKLVSEEYYVKNIKNSKKQKNASKITKIEYKKF